MGAYLNEGALKQLENDLVVVGEFMAFTKSEEKRTKFKRRDNAHKGTLCKHMDTEMIVSDLTEKKLFSFTDSTVVEA